MLAFEGIVKNLERRYRETDSSQQRERIEEYMSFRPCPQCGARLKPEVLAVTVGDRNIHEFSKMSVTRAIEFLDSLELTQTEQLIGRIIKEIRERRRSSTTSGSSISSSTARPRRCPAARRSNCGRDADRLRSSSACSTSSTSRRSGSTSGTTRS